MRWTFTKKQRVFLIDEQTKFLNERASEIYLTVGRLV